MGTQTNMTRAFTVLFRWFCAMAPKKRPAAAQSGFSSTVSGEVKENPVIQPGQSFVNLQACRLIPVKEKDKWIPKMISAFGGNENFWKKHHGTTLNASGLTAELHKAMDADSGMKIAFLPDLQKSHAKMKKTSSRNFLVLHQRHGAGKLNVNSLFVETAVEDITEQTGGFTVKFGGGLCVLVGQKFPTQFFNVCGCFRKIQKEKVKEDIQKLSDVKKVIRQSLVEKVGFYIFNQGEAKRKGNTTAGKTHSAIKAGNNLRIMYRFAKDLQFYTVRGLQARALRLLGHKDFKDLKNGKHFTGDDFSDEESTEEDRSAPDEDAQKDLLTRACRDSVALSNMPVQHLHEPPKKKRRC